jgi:hypothetical protein
MLLKKSLWLRDALGAIPVSDLSPLLNLGSSTAQFREKVQPYIDSEISAPLRAPGARVIHCDLKQDDGNRCGLRRLFGRHADRSRQACPARHPLQQYVRACAVAP